MDPKSLAARKQAPLCGLSGAIMVLDLWQKSDLGMNEFLGSAFKSSVVNGGLGRRQRCGLWCLV